MKNIFTFLIVSLLTLGYSVAQTVSYPIYDGTFGGATHKQVFEFPTGAQVWAGFANNNKSIYPLDFPNGGKITFKASASAATSVKFKFEKDVHPDVNPSFETAVQAITATETEYTIAISSQGTNTFKSALFYVIDRDIEVYISEVKIEKYDTDGSTVIATNYPIYDGPFGGATHKQVIEFPTAAQDWGGFSNNNIGIYPLSFANGGEISFKASASAAANLNFKFEANPHPNVEPSYRTANIPITAAEGTYTVTIPSQGANTFNSALLYVVERDITVNISEVKITANAGTPSTDATLSDLQVDNTTIAGFSGTVTSYTYKLPKGTTTVPQITTATAAQAAGGATVTITQATAIPGDATVEVTATDGTTKQTYTVSFIASLPNSAPLTPPTRNSWDVISVYGEAYGTAIGLNNTDWDKATFADETIAGNVVLKAELAGGDYLGADLAAKIDASEMTHFHIDYWIAGDLLTGQTMNTKWSNHAGGNVQTSSFQDYNTGPETGTWKSRDIDIEALTGDGNGDFSRTELAQLIVTLSAAGGTYPSAIYIDNVYFYRAATASINDIESNVNVYPNPVENTLNVSAGDVVDSLTIFDLTGREVMRATPNKAVFTLDTANLQQGVYMLSLQVGDSEITKKLVK